jgi:flagellar M-ring protein FliF
MDFLNKASTQFVDLFRSMTPAARLTAGLLAAVIVVALVMLFQFKNESADDYLLGGRPFMAGELTAVQRALAEAKLQNWELEGNRIKIPRGQKAVYIAALAENNALPSDWNAALDKAVDGGNPFRSRHEIDLSLQRAKQKELGMVIARFRNVEQASVLFDEVEKDGFRRTKLKTASVAVQSSGTGLDEQQVRAIQNLLATSYAGLDRGNITITDTTTGLSYGRADEHGEGGDSLYAVAKAKNETDWRKKIYDRLSMIPGVVVGVNVDLSPQVQSDTTTIKLDSKPVPIRSTETTRESSSSAPVNAGRPGAVPNGVAPVGNQPAEVASAAGPKSQESESRSEQQNIAGHEQTISRKAPLIPERVTASIDVPASYYVKVWRQMNPTPAGQTPREPDATDLKKIEVQEKQRIEEAVVNLLPAPPLGKPPYPMVTVTTYTDLPASLPAAESLGEQASGWFAANWRTIGMFAIGLVGLVMLRGMLRGGPAPEAPLAGQAQQGSHDAPPLEADDEEERPEPILVMRRKLSTQGPNLREELRQLVKEDPDAAASVLRGWIGDAA